MSEGLAPGVVLRDYKLESHLGTSSLGEVYIAININTEKKVSLEILDGSDPDSIARLSQEIELLASLDHPNIVKAFDAGQDGNYSFLASEYEEGNTLEQIIKQGIIAEADALKYVIDISKALQCAWEQRKISHRDVKPTTIYVTNENTAKLMGFGIAKSNETQSLGLTGAGFTIGTPEYMSPEQIKSEDLDFRSDMYSLGCVLYEMVTGKLPFDESAPILLMQKQMDEDPVAANEVNSAISQECTDLIFWLMQKSKDDRPGNWEGLIKYIDGVLAGEVKSAAAPAPAEEAASEEAEAVVEEVEAQVHQEEEEPAAVEEAAPAEKKGCAAIIAFSLLGTTLLYLLVK